jgi:hypothetical protein
MGLLLAKCVNGCAATGLIPGAQQYRNIVVLLENGLDCGQSNTLVGTGNEYAFDIASL